MPVCQVRVRPLGTLVAVIVFKSTVSEGQTFVLVYVFSTGATGGSFKVTVPPVAILVLSPALRTRRVYVPGATPLKVGLL